MIPVGERQALADRNTGDFSDQLRQRDGINHAAKTRGDLRVENVRGDFAEMPVDRFEILVTGMDDLFDGRVGDQFSVSYSFDGASYTPAASFYQPMVVDRISVFSGNDAGVGHTAVVDHFRNVATP